MGMRRGFAKSGQFLQVDEFYAYGTSLSHPRHDDRKSEVLVRFTSEVLAKSFFA